MQPPSVVPKGNKNEKRVDTLASGPTPTSLRVTLCHKLPDLVCQGLIQIASVEVHIHSRRPFPFIAPWTHEESDGSPQTMDKWPACVSTRVGTRVCRGDHQADEYDFVLHQAIPLIPRLLPSAARSPIPLIKARESLVQVHKISFQDRHKNGQKASLFATKTDAQLFHFKLPC